MPDGIAVLCDTHGNLPALETVLADVADLGVDRIVLDGEIVVVGHCHMPDDRLVAGPRLDNAGSVGMPCGYAGAAEDLASYPAIIRAQQAHSDRW